MTNNVKNNFPSATIVDFRGAPALSIEGRPLFPFVMMTTEDGLREIQKLGYEGSHLYTTDISLGWVGEGRYDYASFDSSCRELLAADPKALVFPRFHVSAPSDWMDARPDEVVGYADPASWEDKGGWGGPRHPSWASELWLKDACEAIRQLLGHAARSEWASHIIGWHVGSGVYGEWHIWNPQYYPDTSPAFCRAFEKWMSQHAPGKPARLPTIAERKTGRQGIFHDPVLDRGMIDHAEFLHRIGAEALLAFAKVVKEESNRRSLVVAFNGYMPDLGIPHDGDHSAFELVVRSPDVDILSSPHTYRRRKPGDEGMFRGFVGSVRAHGKLWLDEQDDRTCFAALGAEWQKAHTHVKTVPESVEILWRGFAQALTHNVGLWMMDQGAMWQKLKEAHFYREKSIVSALESMCAIGDRSMTRERKRVSEVAIICSYRTRYYVADPSPEADPIVRLYATALAEWGKCGVPFDIYQISEMFDKGVPEYKAYVFLDTFFMSEAELKQVNALKARGKSMLYYYAPALMSETAISLERTSALLGMPVRFAPSADLTIRSLEVVEGTPCAKGVELFRKGNQFFTPESSLPANEIRLFCQAAGVHIYSETDDPVLAGGGYISLHAASTGVKTLRSSIPVYWVNERTGERTPSPVDKISMPMEFGQTVLFSVEPV